jgi:hypothetical protein
VANSFCLEYPMSRKERAPLGRSQLLKRALSRWDNEGGAGPDGPQEVRIPPDVTAAVPQLGNAELVQPQVRTIALENLVIALLSQASPQQLDLVREMAAYISPRPGFTPHPLTIHGAAQMLHLVERAVHIRDSSLPETLPAREP